MQSMIRRWLQKACDGLNYGVDEAETNENVMNRK